MICRFHKVSIICISIILYFSDSIGCQYNVRDIGFADILTRPYQLYFYIQEDTPDTLVSIFKQISNATFVGYNIEVEIINKSHDKENQALEYYYFWDINSIPAVILQSPTGRSMIIPISDNYISFKETVWSSLEWIALSPVREEILNNIVKSYAVILLVEGENKRENNKVYDLVLKVKKEISKVMDQMPKRIDEPPHIIVISQEIIPDEKILLWSLDLDEEVGKEPAIVFLFGRGRRFGPILRRGEISQSKLLQILSLIGLSCECGLDLTLSIGSPILSRWGEQEQRQVVQYLGIDVENPMIKMEMANILSLNRSSQAKDIIRDFDDVLEGYSEEIIKSNQRSSAARVSPSQMQDLDSAGSNSIFSYSLYVMSFLALLAFAGGGYVLFRAGRKKP